MKEFKFFTEPVMLDKDGKRQDPKRGAVGAKEAYRARVEYKLIGGNSQPYFAITCEGAHRVSQLPKYNDCILVDGAIFAMDSAGCQHDVVRKLWPELAPYLKWHLAGPYGPMHYLENSVYHWKCAKFDYFESSCVWGALPGDADHKPESFSDETELRAWLEERLPALCELFAQDMAKVQGLRPQRQSDVPATT